MDRHPPRGLVPRWMSWAVVVVNGLLGVGLVVGGAASGAAGHVRMFAVAFGFTLVSLALAFWSTSLGRRAAAPPFARAGAVVVPWRDGMRAPAAALTSLVVSAGMLAVAARLDGHWSWWVAAPVALALACLLPGTWRRALGGGRLELSPRELVIRTPSETVRLDWDRIERFEVRWAESSRLKAPDLMITVKIDDGSVPHIPVAAMDIPPDRLLDALTGYARNPYRRRELSTTAGVYRWQLLSRPAPRGRTWPGRPPRDFDPV